MTKLYKNHHNRLRIILIVCLSFMLVSTTKTFYLQVFKSQDKSIEIQKIVKGDRGVIYDRNLTKLAYDINFYDLYLNKNEITDIFSIKYFLNEYFEYNTSNLDSIINISKKSDVLIVEGVPYYKIDELSEVLKLYPQIKKSIQYKGRYYPEKSLASQIIGKFSHKNDTIGRWGVERILNELIKAKKNKLSFSVTSRGRIKKRFLEDEYLALSGQDVMLTIDIEYQKILEQELIRQMENTGSKSANGLIINPFNGEILAIASVPSSNLNNKLKEIELIRDYVCNFSYEPGSTLKPFSILAGMKNNKINLEDKYFCENGRYKIPGLNRKRYIQDHDPHDTLSVNEILAHSSNIGLVKVSSDIGMESIYNTFREFGFGQRPMLDEYSTSAGLMKDLNKWNIHSLVSIPIGQELRVTNLQIGLAYSAIANGGYLIKPKLFYKKNHNNESSQIVRKVANETDLDKLVESLKLVVSNGTAAQALENHSICSYGKTGTAQVYDKDSRAYSDSLFISTYAGVFPCENPKLVCVISFINPEVDKKWASQSAVPAFREIINRIVNRDQNLSMDIAHEIR